MSFPVRVSLAVLCVLVALIFLSVGALELVETQDSIRQPAYKLFFSLAAICVGAAAGVMLA